MIDFYRDELDKRQYEELMEYLGDLNRCARKVFEIVDGRN